MPDLAYGIVLGLTIAVEVPIVTTVLVRWFRVPLSRAIVLDVAANLLTHPTIWFVLAPALRPRIGELGFVLTAEGFAWLVEGVLFVVVVATLIPAMRIAQLNPIKALRQP